MSNKQFYKKWLRKYVHICMFEELSEMDIDIISERLVHFCNTGYFDIIRCPSRLIILNLFHDKCDEEVFNHVKHSEFRNYRTFNSEENFTDKNHLLRITIVDLIDSTLSKKTTDLNDETINQLHSLVHARNKSITKGDIRDIVSYLPRHFSNLLTIDLLSITTEIIHKSLNNDFFSCETLPNFGWMANRKPSTQIVFGLRNITLRLFLRLFLELIQRHDLSLTRINTSYIKPFSEKSTLVVVFSLHGQHNKACWEVTSMPIFLQELAMLQMHPPIDQIHETFVLGNIIRGNLTYFIRAASVFVHQLLLYSDRNLYREDVIENTFCSNPTITEQLCLLFEARFHPKQNNTKRFDIIRERLESDINSIDTGYETKNIVNKNILNTAVHFIVYCFKTNFFRPNKSGLSFRVDANILDVLPYNRQTLFPEIPYGIFFIMSMEYYGFHIRFRDLSRGGIRTIIPRDQQHYIEIQNQLFQEVYNLALTQQKKNKDIPEGGSKGAVVVKPYTMPTSQRQLILNHVSTTTSKKKADEMKRNLYRKMKDAYIEHCQKSYIDNLLVLINTSENHNLKARNIVDHYHQPEYIYIGPDENIPNSLIKWISDRSFEYGYFPLRAFISSKPNLGINHKEFGVTSYGVHEYLKVVLKQLGFLKENKIGPFTVKMSGGPDGDVAGNQIINLKNDFPNHAKIIALTDGTGTIYDPEGLCLDTLVKMFHRCEGIHCYPPKLLHTGGFLLDIRSEEKVNHKVLFTIYRKNNTKTVKSKITGHKANHLYRTNVHQTQSDIFIPAGGRPRTLNKENINEFFTLAGKPTSRAIVEGANLYLTDEARTELTKHGVWIIRDSSANKGGVICSSYEVLHNLILDDKTFLNHKDTIVKGIMNKIESTCYKEATLLFNTLHQTNYSLPEISVIISKKINEFTDDIFNMLSTHGDDHEDVVNITLRSYLTDYLHMEHWDRVNQRLPKSHKHAIVASYLASTIVYHYGIDWKPTIATAIGDIVHKTDILQQS